MRQMAEQAPQQFEALFDQMVAKRAAELTTQLAQQERMAQGSQQDPLVRLKQQEIDLKALDLQRKADEVRFREEKQDERQEADLAFKVTQLEQNKAAAGERMDVAREKLEIAREKANVKKN
jgi:hypothetical protein